MNIEDRLLSLCKASYKASNKNSETLSNKASYKASNKILSIETDSRKVMPGSIFVALKGKTKDGHNYLEEAIKKGAKALVVEKNYPPLNRLVLKKNSGWICKTANTRKILPLLLNEFYDHPTEKMFCVGVTGTNGKTTLSHILYFLFSQCGWRTSMIGTIKNKFENLEQKNALTTPESTELFKIINHFYTKGAKALVMEVSSIGLDQERTEGIDFNLAVFTNLSKDHLDYHLNMESYFQSKKKLFERSIHSSKNHFLGILNLDDPYGVRLAQEIKTPYISYGHKNARFSWEILSQDLSGTWFKLLFENKALKAYLPLPGLYNVSNAVAALCCVHSAGFSLEQAIEALAEVPQVPGRLERICPHHPSLIFIDYAHTPQALKAVLSFLNQHKKNKIITVFGCGGNRDKEKRPLMANIAETFSDKVILTSDNPRKEDPLKIIQDSMTGVQKKEKFTIEVDRKKAIEKSLLLAKKEDILLVAGKGHEREQIVGQKRVPFNDIEVIKNYIGKI